MLSALRAATKQEMPNANHMISGPLQGRLLKSLVAIKGAKRVLEIGTFTGYSAQCMAEALKEGGSTGGGKIVTLEIDPEAAAIAKARDKRICFYMSLISQCLSRSCADLSCSLNVYICASGALHSHTHSLSRMAGILHERRARRHH